MDSNSTSTSTDPPFFFVLGALELALTLFEFPVSAMNLFLIGRTTLIHPNLKAILLYQSCSIFLRGGSRFAICLFKFIAWAPVAVENTQPWHTLYFIAFYNRNFCAHVLIIERVLATVKIKTYENARNWHFTVCWILIVFSVSLYNATSGSSALVNILTMTVLFFAGLLEFALFLWLYFINRKVYKNAIAGQHNLSERYQLSENIRIGKQLVPNLLFQLWNVAMTTFTLYFNLLGPPQYYAYAQAASNLSGTFCGLMIEITTITCHPFLRRDMLSICQRAFDRLRHSNRISDNEHLGNIGKSTIALRDLIDGKAIDAKRSVEEHFAQLQEAWH